MLHDLFINTLILISSTFVGGHIIREMPEGAVNKLYGKIFLGFGGGILGILMMIYTIEVVGTNTLLDLRGLSVMMINCVGGFVPTVIAGSIIALFRVGYFGINQASVFGVIHVCLYILIFQLINRMIKADWKNWFMKLLSVVIILVSTFLYLLRHIENRYIIIVNFALVVIAAGTLEYFLLNYAKRSNELYRRYKKDSTRDFLTGLNNTRQFDQLLNISFEKVRENGEKLSCLMVDIDHFKKVNDTYGHPVGDMVLKELADILIKNCRTFDIIGRVGGEEFSLLLLDCPAGRAFEIGMRIRNAVKAHNFPIGNNKTIMITVSIGAATYPDTVQDLEILKEKADNALYEAKRSGRDRVCGGSTCSKS